MKYSLGFFVYIQNDRKTVDPYIATSKRHCNLSNRAVNRDKVKHVNIAF